MYMLRLFIPILLILTVSASAGDLDELIKSARLIFEDDFNRVEQDDSKEELGKNWVTNSKSRAKGQKQCDLTGELVKISMASVADHGVSMRHDAPFDDEIVIAIGGASSGRAHARTGDRYQDMKEMGIEPK